VINWHLLADPAARYTDLGASYYQTRTDTDRKLRNHIRQIQALGFEVTLTKAGLPHTGPDQARSPRQARARCRAPIYRGLFSGPRPWRRSPQKTHGRNGITRHKTARLLAWSC
jgi:hypothetical protein